MVGGLRLLTIDMTNHVHSTHVVIVIVAYVQTVCECKLLLHRYIVYICIIYNILHYTYIICIDIPCARPAVEASY